MSKHVMREKTYVNADPEETIGSTGFTNDMSLHGVKALKVIKNKSQHLPREDDIVFIHIRTGKNEGFTVTLFADKGVQL
tara:strand:- start:477 stop:713 length:237 start_codon:yes stop_codon:yes gene_type:complete